MKALSIRQPWAWLIVHGHKNIENRTWNTSYRGAFYVHASKKLDNTKWERDLMRDRLRQLGIVVPDDDRLHTGGLVGWAWIVDVVECSKSPWFTGPHGLVLEGARPMRFKQCNGRLGFFDVEERS
jgi:hypothetical protein